MICIILMKIFNQNHKYNINLSQKMNILTSQEIYIIIKLKINNRMLKMNKIKDERGGKHNE